MKARAALAVALALASCATVPREALGGSWGGRGIALTLGATSGRLEYDCASGTIDGPLLPDASGRFVAAGTHTPGQGGPVRVDHPPPTFPARYRGTVRGDEMQLTVDVPARGLRLGPFSLRRGAPPMLFRCL